MFSVMGARVGINLSPDKRHFETNMFGSEMRKGNPLSEPDFK